MRADGETLLEPARAVLEDGCRLVGGHGLEEVVGLAVMQRRPFEERDHFVEDGRIAGRVHVVRHAVAQPRTVIGDAAADPAARLRQPPVLDVALRELPARGTQQMLARESRLRDDESHRVLQLVAEAVCAARLVERAAGPQAASECLVEQPAVQHDVERPIRRLHRNRPEHGVPVAAHALQARVEVGARASVRSWPARRASWPPRQAATRSRRMSWRRARVGPAARRTDRVPRQCDPKGPSGPPAPPVARGCRCAR